MPNSMTRSGTELIHQGHTTSLTITPTLWIRRTHAVGLHVKQGKGGGVSAYPEIAADFHLWLDPKREVSDFRASTKCKYCLRIIFCASVMVIQGTVAEV